MILLSDVLKSLQIPFVVLALTMFAVPARAIIEPSPLATDARIKTLMYAPNEVIKYTGYFRYQTNILFAPDETIDTISMGDSTAWMINPMGNRLFIKPIDQEATTNMTLITNKRTYFFELHAAEAKDINDKNIPFEVRFVYPMDDNISLANNLDKVPNLEEEDLSKFNFKYTITGSEEISPIRIFDDGEFTYFQFHNINADIPAFYQVDASGNESLVNYRSRGTYIVIERVSSRYTLRHGNSVVCVYNEARPFGKVVFSDKDTQVPGSKK